MSKLTVVQMPTLTQTTSGTTSPVWDTLDDAIAITFSVDAATTGANTVLVAYTTHSTATFFPLTYNSSGASIVTASSGIAITVTPVSFEQLRFATTAAPAAATLYVGSRQISV